MLNRSLQLTAALGIALVTVIGLTASRDLGMLIGTLLSWAPYAAAVIIQRAAISSRRMIGSLAGGLLVYLVIDLFVRYRALHDPGSSTDAVAVMLILIGSVIIIPAGAAITYLLLSVAGNENRS